MGKSSGTGPPRPGWGNDGHVTITRATDQSQQELPPAIQEPPPHCFFSPGGVGGASVGGWMEPKLHNQPERDSDGGASVRITRALTKQLAQSGAATQVPPGSASDPS